MNLYGRPITEPIDPAADRIPILDVSETGDENKMRDATVAELTGSMTRIQQLAGIDPTPDEIPEGTWRVCRDSEGNIVLWANDSGTMNGIALRLLLPQP